MTLDRILPFARNLLEKVVVKGDRVIDATCGNGWDTVFLSHLVGEEGKVYAFDVQEEAIERAGARLREAQIKQVDLILDGHENVLKYVNAEVSAAIFNLGYLPGSDKTITTHGPTTWKAVVDILSLLAVGGIIVLVIYHGHEAGKVERAEIEAALVSLDPRKAEVLRYEFLNKNNAPYVIAIEKLKC